MVEISPLTLEDCPPVAQLHQMVFYRGWFESEFISFLKDPHVFGLKIQQDGVLCGYILWREVDLEAEILTLVVAPTFQRKGLGHHLLQALFERLKNHRIHKLFLEVAEDNVAAKSLYIKHKFALLRTIPNYYGRPGGKYVNGLSFVRKM